MFKEESIWIKNKISEILIKDSKEINTVLDVGSSTLKFRTLMQPCNATMFRTLMQPCIDENIFKPLRAKRKEIYYLDIKKDEGVNIVCDINDINTISKNLI